MTAPPSSKSTFAGIFDMTAGVMGLIGGIILLLFGLIGSGVMAHTLHGDEQTLALIPLAFFLPLALLCLISGALAVWGGSAALQRRGWPLVVLGGIAATVCFFPLGIAALVLTVMSEAEFERR